MNIGKTLFLVSAALLIGACGKNPPAAAAAPQPGKAPEVKKTEPVVAAPTAITFEGVERTRPCSLIVHREWQEGNAEGRQNYRAEVSTPFSDTLGKIVLTFPEDGDGKVLVWENKEKKENFRLDLKDASDKITEPVSFSVKHFVPDHGHTHSNKCSALKVKT